MKIVLYSDIHTEFWAEHYLKSRIQEFLKADADVCVLAGDIAVGRNSAKKVLKYFADAYKHVIYLPGNHEYYGSSVALFDSLDKLPSNVYFLNPGFIKLGDVTFIGACLWTNFGNDPLAELAARSMIMDFGRIGDFRPEHAKAIYEQHLQFIKKHYEIITGKKVIVSHFLPAQACISPRFNDGNLLNKYFANNLDDWISTLSNTTWMFGHTHDSIDLKLGDTRLVCNPYGYEVNDVNQQFDFNKVIHV